MSVTKNYAQVNGAAPPVRWMRIEVATAMSSVAPTSSIMDSYNKWQGWADTKDSVCSRFHFTQLHVAT